MPRPIHRRRRFISLATARRIQFLFRYSESRDAYILKGIGGFFGPVFKVRRPTDVDPPIVQGT